MTEFENKLKKELNEEQFLVATYIDGPASVNAGAGSGKTHTLISRVANLVDRGTPPERILMVTFTNAAADEMRERATRTLDSRCGNIVACTYHKFCNILLRKYGSNIGMGDYTILSYPETKNMINYVKNSNPRYDNLSDFPSDGMLADIISISINKMQTIREVISTNEKYKKYVQYVGEIKDLAKEIEEYCFENKKFTYDDLLIYANKLLDDKNICQYVATSYEYIMVDEFQDTNNLQEEIILKISKFNPNIVVVGDISQSIYAFRGANVRNLQNFHTKIPNCKKFYLSYNYRSSQEILDAANSVMKHHAKSWQYHNMQAVDKKGPKPSIIKTNSIHSEAEDVIKLIEYYHSNGVPYSEIAILERSSMSSFEIENKLTQLAIDFNKMGGMKFMDYDAVGDMLAFFSIITNPHDLLGWFRILQLLPNIGETFAKRVADTCENSDFLIENPYKKRQFYLELVGINNKYNELRQERDLMTLFDKVSDYYFDLRTRKVENSRKKNEAKEDAFAKIENDKKVVLILKELASKYTTIVNFVDDIVLDATSPSKKEGNDVMTISTIHSAKGLEWQVVIILDYVEGPFPKNTNPSKWGSEEDEEELRCFYVAMTRAKDFLYLMVPQMKMSNQGKFERTNIAHYLSESLDKFREFYGLPKWAEQIAEISRPPFVVIDMASVDEWKDIREHIVKYKSEEYDSLELKIHIDEEPKNKFKQCAFKVSPKIWEMPEENGIRIRK